MAEKPVPEGYHAVTPYLIFEGAARAIDWYTKVFGATELMRMPAPGGRIGHAEIRIGDSVVMLADAHPEMGAVAPARDARGSSAFLMVYVPDVDRTFREAVAAGARQQQPLEDKFYGDRSGGIVDPFGHHWTIATHTEDVSPEEMERRAAAAHKG